ncbi:hypothetical protein [Nocardia sp. NPDC059228]|uniref:hypothetical protein n=1 Tax=Nocardia sp. NPDC059228 TaxID=3346777 RepID=UPI0036C89BF0
MSAAIDSTAAVHSLAAGVCIDLNNGANKDDEANDLYQEALDESTMTGIHLSHDDAATLPGLAMKDVCPTAGK